MGKPSRTTLIVVLVAAAVSACGGTPDPEAAALDAAADAAAQITAFCDSARVNVDTAKPLADFAAAGGGNRPADKVTAVTAPVREANDEMLAKAPAEIKADASAVMELATLQLAAFEACGGDAAAAAKDPAYVTKAGEVKDSAARLRIFLRNRCGIVS